MSYLLLIYVEQFCCVFLPFVLVFKYVGIISISLFLFKLF